MRFESVSTTRFRIFTAPIAAVRASEHCGLILLVSLVVTCLLGGTPPIKAQDPDTINSGILSGPSPTATAPARAADEKRAEGRRGFPFSEISINAYEGRAAIVADSTRLSNPGNSTVTGASVGSIFLPSEIPASGQQFFRTPGQAAVIANGTYVKLSSGGTTSTGRALNVEAILTAFGGAGDNGARLPLHYLRHSPNMGL